MDSPLFHAYRFIFAEYLDCLEGIYAPDVFICRQTGVKLIIIIIITW